MSEPNVINSETKLFCSIEQAEQLIQKLEEAIRNARYSGSMEYARQDVEQFSTDGPWRLVLAVKDAER